MLTADLLRALPKAELHLHFEGAVPWPLPGRPAWWADDFRFGDFTRFREAARACLTSLTSLPAYGAAAAVIFRDLRAQNVRYVEISLDVVRLAEQALRLNDVVAVIKAAAPVGLVVRVIAGFSYHKAERTPGDVIDAVLGSPVVDGVDLHGDESRESTVRFADVFRAARDKGLITKAHAGELVGPPSIVRALDLLGVRRIEHGVRAIEDAGLVERLAAEAITLDLCPWSNVKLGIVPELATHPVGRLHARGVPVTISTDDPTVFGRSLTAELSALTSEARLSVADIARMQANTFRVAAMPDEARAAALREIAALLGEIDSGKA